jgi:hypothetical protein
MTLQEINILKHKSAYWKARFAAFTPQEKLQIYRL